MNPDYQHRHWSDGRRIDILDKGERAYWTKFFSVDEYDLFTAVDKVGTSAGKVRQYLNR